MKTQPVVATVYRWTKYRLRAKVNTVVALPVGSVIYNRSRPPFKRGWKGLDHELLVRPLFASYAYDTVTVQMALDRYDRSVKSRSGYEAPVFLRCGCVYVWYNNEIFAQKACPAHVYKEPTNPWANKITSSLSLNKGA